MLDIFRTISLFLVFLSFLFSSIGWGSSEEEDSLNYVSLVRNTRGSVLAFTPEAFQGLLAEDGSEKLRQFQAALSERRDITELDFSRVNWKKNKLKKLLKPLVGHPFQRFIFDHGTFKLQDIEALSSFLPASLRELSLAHTNLSDLYAMALGTAFRNLEVLNLSHTQLSDFSLLFFKTLLETSGNLQKLDLGSLRLSAGSGISLLESLNKSRALLRLNLLGTDLADAPIGQAIASFLEARRLGRRQNVLSLIYQFTTPAPPNNFALVAEIVPIPLKQKNTLFTTKCNRESFSISEFYSEDAPRKKIKTKFSQNEAVELRFTGEGHFLSWDGVFFSLAGGQVQIPFEKDSCLLRKNFIIQKRKMVARHRHFASLNSSSYVFYPPYGQAPSEWCCHRYLLGYGGHVFPGKPLSGVSQVFAEITNDDDSNISYLELHSQGSLVKRGIVPPHGGRGGIDDKYHYIDTFKENDTLSIGGLIEIGKSTFSITFKGEEIPYKSYKYSQTDTATNLVKIHFERNSHLSQKSEKEEASKSENITKSREKAPVEKEREKLPPRKEEESSSLSFESPPSSPPRNLEASFERATQATAEKIEEWYEAQERVGTGQGKLEDLLPTLGALGIDGLVLVNDTLDAATFGALSSLTDLMDKGAQLIRTEVRRGVRAVADNALVGQEVGDYTYAALTAFGGKGLKNLKAAKLITVNHRDKIIKTESVANALLLRTQLAFQEAGILDKNGKLTQKAIKGADPAGAKGGIKNQKIIKALTKDGSHINDWQKLTTESVRMPNGQSRQIHYYRNHKTGKVDYQTQDFKVKDIIDQ